MTDKNGRTIQTGDVVRIENGYFKNSNGLFYVERGTDEPSGNYKDLWLHKISKKGEISIGKYAGETWPLRSYCSKASKNREARLHNEQYATIEVVDDVPKYAIADYFKCKADAEEEQTENMRRRGWAVDAEKASARVKFYRETFERLGGDVIEKKEELGVKFYYNGIKVDGDKKLIGVWYGIDTNETTGEIMGVNIYAKDYGSSLPDKYFNVENDSDIMTDYFDKDSTYISNCNPLFKYALYSALKGIVWNKTYRKPTEKQLELWNTMKDPKQPTLDECIASKNTVTKIVKVEIASYLKKYIEQKEKEER